MASQTLKLDQLVFEKITLVPSTPKWLTKFDPDKDKRGYAKDW